MKTYRSLLLALVLMGTALAVNLLYTPGPVLAALPLQQFMLTVTFTGGGGGHVVGSPAGIDCYTTCSVNASGSITLTATPLSGSAFSGWSNEGCSGSGTCTVNVDQARNVYASFSSSVHGGGPPGGPISSVAVLASTPATVYVSTEFGGVFKSLDGGDSWATMESGLGGINSVGRVVIAPSSSSTLYVATDKGVFRSTDGAATWVQKPFNLDVFTTNVSALAVDPGSSTTVYAGADSGRLYKSTNGGDTWAAANSGLGSTTITALVIHPSTTSTIYAGTADSGVFKTVDGGGVWAPSNTGLTVNAVVSLAVDPSTPSILYAGTNAGNVGGVFKSTDSGGNWTPMNSGLYYPYMSAVAVDPITPATIYGATSFGGLFKSVDGAANWTHVDSLLFYSTRALAIASGAVHVGTRQGQFRSINSGTTWTRTNSGISNNAIGSLGLGPGASSPLYAGTAASSLYRSANGGNTWTNLSFS